MMRQSCYRSCRFTSNLSSIRLSRLRRCLNTETTSTLDTKTQDVANISQETIVIPKRKKRTPTSILEALASTVGKDHTAPAFTYMDDPFLIPTDSFNKKNFSLSKAAGKKAAKYLANRYSKHVKEMYDFAEPKIEAFQIQSTTFEHEEASEDGVLERIEQRSVLAAVEMYKALQTKGGEISESTLEKLLELLCIYNCEEPSPMLEREEAWYRRDVEGMDKTRPTWRDNCIAEEIFESMSEKTPSAYNSLLKGYCKFNNNNKAWDIYCEMKDKKIAVSLSTTNYLLRTCAFTSESLDAKWNRIITILRDMSSDEISPNMNTFNSVLFSLSRMNRYRKSKGLAFQVVKEMINCQIEYEELRQEILPSKFLKYRNLKPCLATWTHFLRVVYDSDDVNSKVLEDVIQYLQGKELTIQDPADLDFFPAAMQKCYHNLQDLELAYKIDAILNTGDNMKFLGDAGKEMNYHSCFFRIVCLMESMENIMKHYDQIAPNVWVPTLGALEELFKALDLHEGYQHLPLIWSDLMLFRYNRNAGVIKQTVDLMVKKKQEPELQTKLAEMARSMKTQWIKDQSANLRNPMELTAPFISDLIIVSVRAEDFDLAWEFMDLMRDESRKITGLLSGPALTAVLEECINKEEVDKALHCVNQLSDQGQLEHTELIEKLKNLPLNDKQSSRLNSLVV